MELSYQLLDLYLTEDQTSHFGSIDDDVRMEIREFIVRHFHSNRSTLYESEYSCMMTLGNCMTSCNEAEHRVYKHHCQGPRPNDNVHKSANKLNDLNKKRDATRARKVAHDMRASVGKAETREKMDERLTDMEY